MLLDDVVASVDEQGFPVAVLDSTWFTQFEHFNVEAIGLALVRSSIEHIADSKDCAEKQVYAFVVLYLVIELQLYRYYVLVKRSLFLPIRLEIPHMDATEKSFWHCQAFEEGFFFCQNLIGLCVLKFTHCLAIWPNSDKEFNLVER